MAPLASLMGMVLPCGVPNPTVTMRTFWSTQDEQVYSGALLTDFDLDRVVRPGLDIDAVALVVRRLRDCRLRSGHRSWCDRRWRRDEDRHVRPTACASNYASLKMSASIK